MTTTDGCEQSRALRTPDARRLALQATGAACGPVCADAGACRCGHQAADAAPPAGPAAWVPQECTLPAHAQPERIAEFDALFAGALQAIRRPAPQRLDLSLDPAQEAAARDLTARESDCCSFFTFTFTRHDDRLDLQITVPEPQAVVLDALTERATAALREAAR